MSDIVPTEEQEAIIASAKGPDPVMVQAYAGTAKTTSISMAAPQIRVPALALAFNKRIASELKRRLPGNWKTSTLNGLGHLAWVRALPAQVGIEVDDRKVGKLVRQAARDGKVDLSQDQWHQVRALVAKAQQAGLSPGDEGSPLVADTPEVWADLAFEADIASGDENLLVELARQALSASIEQAKKGKICFDDQIYCPTILGGKWPRYPAIAVDEAQDLSIMNHRMVELASRSDSKVLVVGDDRQAIYAWRGADSDSMRTLRRQRQGWVDRKLTLTFRCPKVIVARQQEHAPGFSAAASAPEGLFEPFGGKGVLEEGWGFADVRCLGEGKIAILCRNNAPLLALAFALIRRGVGPVVAGRDIGRSLGALVRKIVKEEDSADLCRGKIEDWETSERSKAEVEGKEDRADSISDRAQALLAVLDGSEARGGKALSEAIEMLFAKEEGDLVLSTIHRAKGLEYDIVVHLDPWRVPSRQARAAAKEGDDGPLRQEMNLRYVCETRTKNVFVHANLEDFR